MKFLIACLLVLYGTHSADIMDYLGSEVFFEELLEEVELDLERKDVLRRSHDTGEWLFDGRVMEFLDKLIPELCQVAPNNCSLVNTYYLDCNCVEKFYKMGMKCSNIPCQIIKKVRDKGAKLLDTVFKSKGIADVLKSVGETFRSIFEGDMCSCGEEFFEALLGCAKFYDANVLYDFVGCESASGFLRMLRNLDLKSLRKFLGKITKHMCAATSTGKCYDNILASLVSAGRMVDNTLRRYQDFEGASNEKNDTLEQSCDLFYRLVKKTDEPRIELTVPRRSEEGSGGTISCNLYFSEYDPTLSLRVDSSNKTHWEYYTSGKRWDSSDEMTIIKANKYLYSYDNGSVFECYSRMHNLSITQTLGVYNKSEGIVENDEARLELYVQKTNVVEEGTSATIRCSVIADKADKSLKLLVNGTSVFSKKYIKWWGKWGLNEMEYEERDNGTVQTYIDTNREYMLSDDGTTFECVSTKYTLRKTITINVYSTASKSRYGDSIKKIPAFDNFNKYHYYGEGLARDIMEGLSGLMNSVYCDETCSKKIAKSLYPCCYKTLMSDKKMFDYLEKFVVSLVKNVVIGGQYNYKDYMVYNYEARNYANYTLPNDFRKLFMEIAHPAASCSSKKKKNPKCSV